MVSKAPPIRCRIVASPNPNADDEDDVWRYYLLNDGEATIDLAVVEEIVYAWGDMGSSEAPDITVRDVPARGHALLWSDDGSGAELRMDVRLRVEAGTYAGRLRFEFPKLYRKRDLPVVAGLGRTGWVEEGR